MSLDIHHPAILIVVLGVFFLQSAAGGADLVPVPLRRFPFVVFQKGSTTDYEYLTEHFVTGSPAQTVDIIEQAARNRIKEPACLGMDDRVKVYEIRVYKVWRPWRPQAYDWPLTSHSP